MAPFLDKSAGIFTDAEGTPPSPEQATKMMPPTIPRVGSNNSMSSTGPALPLFVPSPSPSQALRKAPLLAPPSPLPRSSSGGSSPSVSNGNSSGIGNAPSSHQGGGDNYSSSVRSSDSSVRSVSLDPITKLEKNIRRSIRKYGETSSITAQLYIQLGNMEFKRGRLDEAAAAYKLAVESSGTTSAEQLATAYLNLGTVYWKTGDVKESMHFLKQSLAVHELSAEQQGKSMDESTTAASAHHQLGVCYALSGDWADATSSLQQALAIRVRMSDEIAVAQTMDAIGKVHLMEGNYDGAMNYHQQALTSFRAAGVTNTSSTLQNIANVHLAAGHPAAALTVLYEVHTMQQGDTTSVAAAALRYQTLQMMAKLLEETGSPDQAEQYRSESLVVEQHVSLASS